MALLAGGRWLERWFERFIFIEASIEFLTGQKDNRGGRLQGQLDEVSMV